MPTFTSSSGLRRQYARAGCLAIVALVTGLSGCQSLPANEGAPASVSEVLDKLKDDLRAYQNYDAQASAAAPLDNTCKGAVGFYIDNVKVQLLTKTDSTDGGSAAMTLPVGPVTVGPSLSGSSQIVGTQTLTFALYPKPLMTKKGEAPGNIDGTKYPFAAALQQLREGLLANSAKEPCVGLIPPVGADGKTVADPGNTFAFGFVVTKTTAGGITVKFTVFSLGATTTEQRQLTNAITVTFKARPGSDAAII